MESRELEEILKEIEVNKILDLSDADLTADNIKKIAETIPNIEGLVAINLSGIQDCLTSETAKYLFDAIKKCKSLYHLDMSLCKLGNQHINSLFQAIQGHPSLLSLELSNNDISYDGVLALTKVLESTKILSLNLSENKIGISAGKEIETAIKHNDRLLLLNLFSSGLNAPSIDRDTNIKISKKIEANLKLFKETLSEMESIAIPQIPKTLLEYLESQISSYSDEVVQLKDNPIVFIGQWQSKQSAQSSINPEENQFNTLPLYEAHLNSKLKQKSLPL